MDPTPPDGPDASGGGAAAARIALAAVVAAGLWLRVAAASGRELWYDDVERLRECLGSWESVVVRLPTLDNLKSPLLIGTHKLWVTAFGADSLPAIRSWGVALGAASVVLSYAVARAAAGRAAGLAAAALVAVAPMQVRWSVEVHNYLPAQVLVLGAWAFALRHASPAPRHWAVFGALAGAAAATFPPAALPVAAAAALPGWDPRRSLRGVLVAAGVAAIPLVLCLASIAASHRAFAAAAAEGRGWLPSFDPLRTWADGTVRTLGLDVAVGWRLRGLWAVVAAVVAATVWAAARAAPATDERRRRVALVVGAWGCLGILAVLGAAGRGVFIERYLIAVGAVAPAAVAALLVSGARGAGVTAFAGRAALGAFAVLVAVGARPFTHDRADLRTGSDFFRFRAATLVAAAAEANPVPPCVLVHGQGPASHVLLRAPKEVLARTTVRHLTTDAWCDALRRGDRTRLSVPNAAGWPFGFAEIAGPGASVGPRDAAALVRAAGSAWIVLDTPGVPRRRYLEEQEAEGGLDAALALLASPPGPQRDRRIGAIVLAYLGLDRDAACDVTSSGHAVLLRVTVR